MVRQYRARHLSCRGVRKAERRHISTLGTRRPFDLLFSRRIRSNESRWRVRRTDFEGRETRRSADRAGGQFMLVVNAKTAALELTVPPTLAGACRRGDRMRRRAFLQGLWTTAASATFLVPAGAQTAKPRPLIVWLGSAVKAGAAPYQGFLKSGLQDLGLVEGRDYDFTDRFAEFHAERLPALAAEVAAMRPTVIVASAVDTALMLKKVTSTIPIVSGALADAEHLGLVESYARPKGNVTGIMPYVRGLPGKQIELALELVPGAK